jgi:uncharacterized C2H2 Zn-finger protein
MLSRDLVNIVSKVNQIIKVNMVLLYSYLYIVYILLYSYCVVSITGTKLRCPFCERTYGYETNLRAHIRQRHQGIRVSCPYCPRTFTRNNTVRRHVAREHRHLGGRIPTKFGSTRVMPDPIRIAQTAASTMRAVGAAHGVQIPGEVIPSIPTAGNTGPN